MGETSAQSPVWDQKFCAAVLIAADGIARPFCGLRIPEFCRGGVPQACCKNQGAAKSAYIQSTGAQGPEVAELQDGLAGAAVLPAEAWRLYPRLHPDAEEAELGAAQSRARSTY